MRLDHLRPLYERSPSGPYASVYLDRPRPGEASAEGLAVHWHDARQALERDGADGETLDAMAAVVDGQAHDSPGIAAFGCGGSVRLSSGLPGAPQQEIITYSALPHVLPLLAQAPPRTAHLRVLADKSGGEIVTVWGDGRQAEAAVAGEGWPVHKTKVGGWSQDRYQRSAEEAWAQNAGELAAAVTAAAERVQAALIVVAGDVRAVPLLVEHLGQPLRDKVVTVDREVPADSDVLAEVADEEFGRLADAAARAGLDSLRTQLPRGHAAEGLAATVAALSDGMVSALFVVRDLFPAGSSAGDGGTLWIGAEPVALAPTEQGLRDRGVADPVPARADAAIVRALTMTDAELHFVPEDTTAPREGIGALLRYTMTQ